MGSNEEKSSKNDEGIEKYDRNECFRRNGTGHRGALRLLECTPALDPGGRLDIYRPKGWAQMKRNQARMTRVFKSTSEINVSGGMALAIGER